MEPIEVGFVLVIYVLPVVVLFGIMALVADIIEKRRK
jgi:uncharacterized protein (DUF3084 family)